MCFGGIGVCRNYPPKVVAYLVSNRLIHSFLRRSILPVFRLAFLPNLSD
jgi:hypothetical protein